MPQRIDNALKGLKMAFNNKVLSLQAENIKKRIP